MNFDCKKCKTFDVCEMTKELGFMNGGCRAYTEKKPQAYFGSMTTDVGSKATEREKEKQNER